MGNQILAMLKQHEAVPPILISLASMALTYQCRAKYGGMDASLMTEMKALRAENARLGKRYAEERINFC